MTITWEKKIVVSQDGHSLTIRFVEHDDSPPGFKDIYTITVPYRKDDLAGMKEAVRIKLKEEVEERRAKRQRYINLQAQLDSLNVEDFIA